MIRPLLLACALLVLSVIGLRSAGTALPPGFTETVISSDLFLPTGFAFTPDRHIIVIEKGGLIKIIRSAVTRVAGRMAVSAQYDETGLLGVAVDPDFSTNGYIYVYYTTSPDSYQPSGHPYRFAWNRVSRLTMSGDELVSDSEVVLLDDIFADTEDEPATTRHGPPHSGHHNGGGLLFGPDGKLYISVGDAQNGANAQDLSVLNGKILRINPDGSAPGDNPFVGTPGARPEIWCLGLRNPWRFTFDALGRMFIGDVGLDRFEEINVGGPGLNFGWPFYEGASGDPRFVDPLYAYPNDGHNTAIAAVGVHRGTGIYPPPFSNVLFFGDFGQGLIHTLRQDGSGGVVVEPFATNAGSPVHFAQGPDGRMYYLSLIPPELRRIDFGAGLINIRITAAIGGFVTTDPEGLACGPDCRAFAPGQIVTLRPAARDGYGFAGWVGHPSCSTGRVTVVEGLSCTAIFQVGATNPLVTRYGVDLSGDGTGDALLYDRASGEWSMAFSNGAGRFAFRTGTWSPNWSITPGDFNGSTLTDFFLYNRETGQWFQCFTDGAGDFSRYITERWSPGWQVFATDLNGDDADDILLYNDASGLYFQCMTAPSGGIASYHRAELRPGFSVAATR